MVAILSTLCAPDVCENCSTLPVPASGSNDWARAGVAIAVMRAMAARSFVTLSLLVLRFKVAELESTRHLLPRGAALGGHAPEETGNQLENSPLECCARRGPDNFFMKAIWEYLAGPALEPLRRLPIPS